MILMLLLVWAIVVQPFVVPAVTADTPSMTVTLQPPGGTLVIGDTPTFQGTVTNHGQHPSSGLVVYVSLVSLQPGDEHPVDLEDWAAQKAVRIAVLKPGQTVQQSWSLRLIQAGTFGLTLTVVDPQAQRPLVSDMLRFDVQSKPTLLAGRILPVALGEPLVLLLLYLIGTRRYRASAKAP